MTLPHQMPSKTASAPPCISSVDCTPKTVLLGTFFAEHVVRMLILLKSPRNRARTHLSVCFVDYSEEIVKAITPSFVKIDSRRAQLASLVAGVYRCGGGIASRRTGYFALMICSMHAYTSHVVSKTDLVLYCHLVVVLQQSFKPKLPSKFV